MSLAGIISVIITTGLRPASIASIPASLANGVGTKIIEAFASVFSRAEATVSNTGRPTAVVPPFPGVTPATILVP